MNRKATLFRFWIWYIAAGLAAAVSYPHIVSMLRQQFTVYMLHVGNPATYIFVYTLYGWWAYDFAKKKWGKVGWRGNLLLFGGLIAITLILHFFFGYNFGF